jgi:hypothetical protein
MPFCYGVVPGANQTSNATPNTANDCFFVAAGTGRATSLQAVYVVGKGAGLTAISGIAFRVEKWTTTASSAGTAITPAARDPGAQAAKATAAFAAATVTSGTGGPTLMCAFGCGAAGPGGWVAPNPDAMPLVESGSADSLDVFNASGTASLNFELSAEIVE